MTVSFALIKELLCHKPKEDEMKIDDIMRLDWKKGKHLLAVQQKLAGLTEHETQNRARVAELDRIVHDGARSIVQARATALLNEHADESAEEIQARLDSAQR